MIARQPEATGTCAMRHVNADLIRDDSLYSRRDTRMYRLLSPIRRRSRGERVFFFSRVRKTLRRRGARMESSRSSIVARQRFTVVSGFGSIPAALTRYQAPNFSRAINLTYWWYLHWMLFSTQPMAPPSSSSLPSHLGGCCDSSIEAGHYKSISLF